MTDASDDRSTDDASAAGDDTVDGNAEESPEDADHDTVDIDAVDGDAAEGDGENVEATLEDAEATVDIDAEDGEAAEGDGDEAAGGEVVVGEDEVDSAALGTSPADDEPVFAVGFEIVDQASSASDEPGERPSEGADDVPVSIADLAIDASDPEITLELGPITIPAPPREAGGAPAPPVNPTPTIAADPEAGPPPEPIVGPELGPGSVAAQSSNGSQADTAPGSVSQLPLLAPTAQSSHPDDGDDELAEPMDATLAPGGSTWSIPPRPWTVGAALWTSLRHHPFIMTLVALVPIALASAWLVVRTPAYASTARLIVDPISDADEFRALPLIHRFGEPTRTVQTAAAVIDTREIAAVTAGTLGSGWTVDDVVENITIGVEGQTNVLRVTGTASSEADAVDLANAYVDAVLEVRGGALRQVLSEEIAALEARLTEIPSDDVEVRVGIEELMSDLRLLRTDPTLSLAEHASAAEPHGQRSAAVTSASSIVIGLVLAGVAGLLLDRRRAHLVRTTGEVEAALGLPVLGEVPGRFGLASRRRRTALTRDLAFRALRYRIRHELRTEAPIVVASVGRGDDSAYVAANLGADLAATGTPAVVFNTAPEVTWTEVSKRLSITSPLGLTDDLNGHTIRSTLADRDLWLLDTSGDQGLAHDQHVMTVFDEITGSDRPIIANVPPLGSSELGIRLSHGGRLVVVVRLDEVPYRSLARFAELLRYGGAAVVGAVVIDGGVRGRPES
jgi:capsular polysaccharide biosynthesis protein